MQRHRYVKANIVQHTASQTKELSHHEAIYRGRRLTDDMLELQPLSIVNQEFI